MTLAKATYAIKSWDENTWDGKPWTEVEGRKFTRSLVVHTYEGDIEGEGTAQSLVFYRDDGTAQYVGLEQVSGRLGGKSGSFAIQSMGQYADGKATMTLTIVPGSGTDELVGLRGEGETTAEGHQPAYPMTLNYHFD